MHIAVLILPAGAGMAAQFASVEKREWLVSMLAARDWRWALMITVSLLTLTSGAAAENVQFAVETLNATIESRDGGRLRVVFGKGEQPALLFKPVQGAWNWSATSKLFIPVENPGDEPLDLTLHIESAAGRSLGGSTSIAPHSAGDLTIWIDAPLPRSMGMIGGPSLKAAGLSPNLPVTATKGSINSAQVTSVRLGIWRPAAPQALTVGRLCVDSPSEVDKTAYDRIVDSFGQLSHGIWPEKVSSDEMLRARGAEEANQLAQRRDEPLKRDRFGGLEESGQFRATGFFRTERRDGRWWLVTPEGNPFFSIGMDTVVSDGATYIDGREFMFRDLPARDGELAAHWSEIAAVCRRSAVARSIMDMRSISIRPTSSASSAPSGARAGVRKHPPGSKPGVSTRLGIGAIPSCGRCIACPTRCLCHPRANMPKSVLARIGGGRWPIPLMRALPKLRTRWRAMLRRGSAVILT